MKPREIAAASVAQVLIKRRCAMGTTLLHAEPADGGDAIVHLAVRVSAARIDEILADCQAVPL